MESDGYTRRSYCFTLVKKRMNSSFSSQRLGEIVSNGGISEAATRRRLERESRERCEALEKQVQLYETRTAESEKVRMRLNQELEIKIRESKATQRKNDDLEQENAGLKSQLDSLVRITHLNSLSTSSSAAPTKKQYLTMNEELRRTKKELENCQRQLENAQEAHVETNLKLKILQETLTVRTQDMDLLGHTDLLGKVAGLRGEVSSLKQELMTKRQKINEIETNSYDQDTLRREASTRVQEQLSSSTNSLYGKANIDTDTANLPEIKLRTGRKKY